MSKKARIPNIIKNFPRIYKFAGIVAFLVDEGNILDCMSFGSSNKNLLHDLQNLLENLGYKTKMSSYHDKYDLYILFIKNKCLEMFYEDYQNLIKNSSFCNLLRKEVQLRILLEVHKRGKGHYYNGKDLKAKIYKILERKKMKINDIRLELFRKYNYSISYRALRKYLLIYEKDGMLHKKFDSSRIIWSLNNS